LLGLASTGKVLDLLDALACSHLLGARPSEDRKTAGVLMRRFARTKLGALTRGTLRHGG
jgi:hypothetical protein